MKIFAALLALISAQCSWDYDKENKIISYLDKNTGQKTVVFDWSIAPIFYSGSGSLEISDFRGEFWVEDATQSRLPHAIAAADLSDSGTELTVTFNPYDGWHGNPTLQLNCEKQFGQVLIDNPQNVNRFWLRFNAHEEDGVYGGGEQFSYFNLRGRKFEMLSREQGMGRNISEIVSFVSRRCCDAAGKFHHTYWPQPTIIVQSDAQNQGAFYYVNFWHEEYSVLDFTNEGFHEIEFHSKRGKQKIEVNFDIDFAPDYALAVQKLAMKYGEQAKLPSWVTRGSIIGLQGGSDRVLEIYRSSIMRDIDVSAIWIQDWAGQIYTDFGDRVFWNWEWNSTHYPELDTIIKDFDKRGVYFLNYINPHLINSDQSKLYLEGEEKGYFVKNKTTGETLLQNFGFNPFKVVSIDLSNPEACEWFKNEIIIKNSIDFGFKGWMADFGEYLPYSDDVLFHDGTTGVEWHNKFSEKWANLNMQALVETNNVGKIFFFSRAGYNGMRTSSTSAWAGDQNVDFSYGDGLATTITAALSLGASGFGITHFDIGGYTAFPPLIRSKELFMRSAEAAVFTPVMRTHEGNRPNDGWQYYCDRCSMKKYARLVNIHNQLHDYLDFLMEENTNLGKPIQRPMLWLDSNEEIFRDMHNQYMLGDDLVVAPVIRRNQTNRGITLPKGTWKHLWDENYTFVNFEAVPGYVFDAPEGFPLVFYRADSKFATDFKRIQRFKEVPSCVHGLNDFTGDSIFPGCNMHEMNAFEEMEENFDKMKLEL